MAWIWILCASMGIALSNLCLRRGIDAGSQSRGFLWVQLFTVWLSSSLLYWAQGGSWQVSPALSILSVVSGIFFYAIMDLLRRSLSTGPAGLTFAVLNGSTVVPAAVMALWVGSACGFSYHVWQCAGSLLVVGALFWAARKEQESGAQRSWVPYVSALFAAHVALLLLMQWRATWITYPEAPRWGWNISSAEASDPAYMPLLFLTALACHTAVCGPRLRAMLSLSAWNYGLLGGIANMLGTMCLLRASEVATGAAAIVLYPLYSIGILALSQGWARLLYQERVRWGVIGLCALGLLVAGL